MKYDPVNAVWEVKGYIFMCDVIGGILIDIFNQKIILGVEISEVLASCSYVFVYMF